MQELQFIGQLLLESKPVEALEALLKWVRLNLPAMRSDVELQLSRVNLIVQNFNQGLMSLPDYQTSLIQINKGILFLLDDCKKTAAATLNISKGPALHEYHAYTCDRVDQSDTFRQVFGDQPEPVQFFFLYGGDLQSHEGLFRRIAYDLEGRLQDYLNPTLQIDTQALQMEMTFEFSRQQAQYRQNILRSFFSMMGLSPNEHEPLLDKDLPYVLSRSPRVQQLKATDYICVYLHISQYDWDPTLTPEAAKWFIHTFCHSGQVATAVPILVFLAIEYDETDAQIRDEIVNALSTAENLHPLPELGMVYQRDVGQWLERYKQLSPNTRTRREILQQAFGTADPYYMEDVELELKKIIDQYNNNILL